MLNKNVEQLDPVFNIHIVGLGLNDIRRFFRDYYSGILVLHPLPLEIPGHATAANSNAYRVFFKIKRLNNVADDLHKSGPVFVRQQRRNKCTLVPHSFFSPLRVRQMFNDILPYRQKKIT